MNKLLVGLTLLSSLSAFSSDIFILSDSKGNRSLVKTSEQYNFSGLQENSFLGFCITSSGECSKSYNMSDAYLNTLVSSNGLLELPEQWKESYVYPNMDIVVKTFNRGLNKLKTDTYVINGEVEYKIDSSVMKYSNLELKIDFSQNDTYTSRRFSFDDVDDKYKLYQHSVFKISGVTESNGLQSIGEVHGTGFFISEDGFALTNLHVMKSREECLINKKCILEIETIADKVSKHTVGAKVIMCNKIDDFCLIKLDIKKKDELKVIPLKIQTNEISNRLMTLGFPGDKSIEDENGYQSVLTYSFGSPVGFSGSAISSSIFSAGGASGSPIIDLKTGNVVGLISAGSEGFLSGYDGDPALFRPLSLINKEYGLIDYLDGSKQSRVKSMIRKISESKTSENSKLLLKAYEQERTTYKLDNLIVLSYKHDSVEVRKEIVKFLLNFSKSNW